MIDIFSGLAQAMAFLLGILGDAFNSFIDFCEKKEGPNAKWGSETDIARRYNKGLLISKHRKLTRRKSFENLIICAPTGSGKTSAFLIKQLLSLRDVTVIITDPSKEIFNLCSGYLSQFFTILTLNFSNWKESSSFNFLSLIISPNDSRVYKISDMLTRSSLEKGSNNDPFWSLSVKNLLSILIQLVIYQPEEQRHMASVAHALNTFASNPKKVDHAIVKTGDNALIERYKGLIAIPERTLQNVVASAQAALQNFQSESVQRVTAYSEIDLAKIRKKPHVIFLHHSPSEGKALSNIIGLFFEQTYTHILDNPVQKDDLDLFVILEETSNTFIPILSQALSLTRKTNTSNVLCIQSQSQLRAIYHDESVNILENCLTKIYLPGISEAETLKQIEMLAGRTEIEDKKTGSKKTVPLISYDSVRTLKKGRTLILSGSNPLIKGRMSGYYKSFKYKAMTKIPPIELKSNIPDTPISLIEFQTPIKKNDNEEAK